MVWWSKIHHIKATREILNGNKILDVAIEYGWESHSGFIKAFKSYYGFSPSLLYAMKLEIIHFGDRDMSNCNFYKIMDEHLSKEELFKVLCEKMIENGYDNQKLNKVYNFCQSIYGDRKRYSGDDYVTHLVNVSLLLVQMEAEESVIYAGMFCDVFSNIYNAVQWRRKMLKEYIWFFPLIFIFHDMEEKIGFGMWLKNKKDTLEKKCPSMLNSHKDFSTEGFSFYINVLLQ